jgi:DNA-binding NtrC family response regulator
MEKILIIDDESFIRENVARILGDEGYEVCQAANGDDARDQVASGEIDLALLDLNLGTENGINILKVLKEIDPELLVIIITGYGSVESAVDSLKLGAYHYMKKPFKADALRVIVKLALQTQTLKREVRNLKRAGTLLPGRLPMIGSSAAFKEVIEQVREIARIPSTVLITGESGTGKELVARGIHDLSDRKDATFVGINCASIPDTLLESELFGHEKGAFTDAKVTKKGLFELADGGTVFLDEIGDMEMGMQAKLLRFLEDRSFRRIGGGRVFSVDVRIISATNKDLQKSIEEKTFRNDLYYRLQVIPIFLPSLRERREDIIPLATHFIANYNREFNKKVVGIAAMAERVMVDYSWPGNIRELKNVIERAIILGNDETLLLEHLPLEIVAKATPQGGAPASSFRLPPEGIDIEEVEKELIRQALEISEWNQSKAAKKLSLGIDAFRYRMKKFGYLK